MFDSVLHTPLRLIKYFMLSEQASVQIQQQYSRTLAMDLFLVPLLLTLESCFFARVAYEDV